MQPVCTLWADQAGSNMASKRVQLMRSRTGQVVEGMACCIYVRPTQAPGWERPSLKLQVLEGGCACMQAFSLSLESMASRSLLHDMGMQQPKIVQFTAWKGPSDHRAAAPALRTLWRSPSFVDSRAKFGLLAANTNIESDEEWESLSAELSGSRRACCLLCCQALTLMHCWVHVVRSQQRL